MKTYEIEQTATAAILWIGKAPSAAAAKDLYAQDAGYRDYAHIQEEGISGGDTLEVRELECSCSRGGSAAFCECSAE